MKTKMMLAMVASFGCLAAGQAFGQGGAELPGKVTYMKGILPSAGMMVGELSKSYSPKDMAAQVKEQPAAKGYAFTTGISEEKGSFKLGVLMADLRVSLAAGDRDKVTRSISSLTAGLAQLGAPAPLVASVVRMSIAVKSGVELDAVTKASLPVLEPFIDDFIEKEGKMTYLRLGEWAESTRLAALAGSQGKSDKAAEFIKKVNPASFFMSELKEKAPSGVINSLKVIADMSGADVKEKDVKSALKAVNDIIQLMS